MDSIPVKLRPLIHRLEHVPDLSREDLISVLFVVRLGDCLHQAFYATFLLQSLVDELCTRLDISDLLLEVDVFVSRWSFQQGTVSVSHRIQWDYDMYAVSVLSKIATGVLDGNITAKEGLKLIREHERAPVYCTAEHAYRNFPGRAAILPLMSCTCATVFFGGTWHDLAFAAACGTAAGFIAWMGAAFEQLGPAADYLAAIVVAMISIASTEAYPDSTCFSAQVIGTLYWFLYGTAYVTSLYEITNNQLITGTTRLLFAIVRSYGLALGVVLGAWLSQYGGELRYEDMADDCSTKTNQIPDIWFVLLFPLAAIACLFQFRVGVNHFVICLIVQVIAYGSQYLLGTVWKQPDFLSNMIPSFLTTVFSHVCITALHWFQLSGLQVRKEAYLQERKKRDAVAVKSRSSGSAVQDDDNDNDNDNAGSIDEEGQRHDNKVTSGCKIRGVVKEGEGVILSDGKYMDKNECAKPDDGVGIGDDDCNNNNNSSSSSLADNNNNSNNNSSSLTTAIAFVSTKDGYALRNDAAGYYMKDDLLLYLKGDLWFCLLPALYLLVPGAKVLHTAFDSIWAAAAGGGDFSSVDSLASSLLMIGLGQVIGLRLGFAFLWLCSAVADGVSRCCCHRRGSN